MGTERVAKYLERNERLKEEKSPWLPLFQSLAEVFLTRKADFSRCMAPGEFLQANRFDNTGQFAAYLHASTILALTWPNAARSFNLKAVPEIEKDPGVEEYFKKVTSRMHRAMDNPEANLHVAQMEQLLDNSVFGTAGLGVFSNPGKDPACPVVYEAWGIKSMVFDEDRQGNLTALYYEELLTVGQILEEYGAGKVAPQVREKAKNKKLDEKLVILKVIERRGPNSIEGKKGSAGMPIGTVHIDAENKLIMREGGFPEMPVALSRGPKVQGEKFGRSHGMMAQPDAMTLNSVTQDHLEANEKAIKPPLVVLDDGRLGGGVINDSAGGVSVFNTSGRVGQESPISTLYTTGPLDSTEKLMERLEDKIFQFFMLDRLLDLNNQTQMTAYETSIRNRLRGESLNSLFARDKKEVKVPLIQRTFNIMHREGFFGDFGGQSRHGIGAYARRAWKKITGREDLVVPKSVREAVDAGLDVYEIEFVSPAQRFMQAEMLQGIFTAMDALIAVGGVIPEAWDNVEPDDLVRDIYQLSGAPRSSLRTLDVLKEVRAANAARQQAATAMEVGKQSSEMARNAAQARMALGTVGAGK